MSRSILRALVYSLPLLLWLIASAIAATEFGGYQHSWDFLHWVLDWIEPGFYHPDPQVFSMYQLTQATRKLAHVAVYAGVALLTIRLIQAGRPRLRPLSLAMALVISGAFLGIEVYLRLYQSEGTRHVRAEQFILNGIGVGAVLLGTPLYFGLKALERWLADDLPAGPPHEPAPPHASPDEEPQLADGA